MIENFIKIAFRNLWKHKLFSFINIFGLSAGMALCILALISLKSAYEYDLFHPNPERTFRVITDVNYADGEQSWATTPTSIKDHLMQFSFVADYTQIIPRSLELSSGHGMINTHVSFIDSAFFRLFGFRIERGSFSSLPQKVILTNESARLFFGKIDPIGKILKQKDGKEYTVTGILAPASGKTHLDHDVLISKSSMLTLDKLTNERNDDFSFTTTLTYVLLRQGSSSQILNSSLAQTGRQTTRLIPSESPIKTLSFRAQSLDNISPATEEILNTSGNMVEMRGILILLAIGIITLILAGFNYINLTMARALTRVREVAVRKVLGGSKTQLFTQFMTETSIVSLFALFLSLIMLYYAQPLNFVSEILTGVHWDVSLFLILSSFAVISGLSAGFIPAKVLSRYSVVSALKGTKADVIYKHITVRKVLLMLQLTISLSGVILMLVTYKQFRFMSNGDLGLNKNNILNINIGETDHRIVIEEAKKQAGVEQVSASSGAPGLSSGNQVTVKSHDRQFSSNLYVQSADHNFLSLLGIKLISGKNLTASASDSSGQQVVLNQKAVEVLNFSGPRSAVGQLLWINDSTQVQIVGVVKDFHNRGVARAVSPMMIRYEPERFQIVQLQVSTKVSAEQFEDGIRQQLGKIGSNSDIDIQWYDKQIHDAYFHLEDQLTIGILTGMVLIIACLGLLGMVIYTVETRVKEVGIRKVMGAKVSQIIFLLSKDFVLLIIIAACIAFPIGIISGKMVIRKYTYQVDVGFDTLLYSFLSLLLIGWISIGWQTFRAAASNPVNTLRND